MIILLQQSSWGIHVFAVGTTCITTFIHFSVNRVLFKKKVFWKYSKIESDAQVCEFLHSHVPENWLCIETLSTFSRWVQMLSRQLWCRFPFAHLAKDFVASEYIQELWWDWVSMLMSVPGTGRCNKWCDKLHKMFWWGFRLSAYT